MVFVTRNLNNHFVKCKVSNVQDRFRFLLNITHFSILRIPQSKLRIRSSKIKYVMENPKIGKYRKFENFEILDLNIFDMNLRF